MPVRLDQFLAAFARAVADAQHDLQRTQLGDLSQFFKNGSPITVDLKLPRVSPDTGQQEFTEVRVPLAILVNHDGVSIRETQITMQVEMNVMGETGTGTIERPYEWKPPGDVPVISVSTVTGGKVGHVGLAQLTLRVAADDVPEGVARLL